MGSLRFSPRSCSDVTKENVGGMPAAVADCALAAPQRRAHGCTSTSNRPHLQLLELPKGGGDVPSIPANGPVDLVEVDEIGFQVRQRTLKGSAEGRGLEVLRGHLARENDVLSLHASGSQCLGDGTLGLPAPVALGSVDEVDPRCHGLAHNLGLRLLRLLGVRPCSSCVEDAVEWDGAQLRVAARIFFGISSPGNDLTGAKTPRSLCAKLHTRESHRPSPGVGWELPASQRSDPQPHRWGHRTATCQGT